MQPGRWSSADRRLRGPYGLQGGEAGMHGENVLIRGGVETALPGKEAFICIRGISSAYARSAAAALKSPTERFNC